MRHRLLRLRSVADAPTFAAATALGRTVIWLHTFGERLADAGQGRPAGPPRLPAAQRPRIPKDGAIPAAPDAMPDTISYDATKMRLLLGTGYVENVEPAVWNYEVSGKQVLLQWFSYRKQNRERPLIGDRRPPSPLGNIQPDHWLAEYTTELLNVLGLLVALEPAQAALLEKICSGPTLPAEALRAAGAFELPAEAGRKARSLARLTFSPSLKRQANEALSVVDLWSQKMTWQFPLQRRSNNSRRCLGASGPRKTQSMT